MDKFLSQSPKKRILLFSQENPHQEQDQSKEKKSKPNRDESSSSDKENVIDENSNEKQELEKKSTTDQPCSESKQEIDPLAEPPITKVWLDQITDEHWKEILQHEFDQPHFAQILKNLNSEWKSNIQIYPKKDDILNAFKLTKFRDIKVVIIGQDPYHGPGEAHGLAFSVPSTCKKIPPSLGNIYAELKNDIKGFEIPNHGNLEHWAKQGVLLLNTCLTVQRSNPASHSNFGWQTFTANILKRINDNLENVVVMMWGKFAQKQGQVLSNKKYLKLQSGHPSPFSVSFFFGNKHFSKANDYLRSKGKQPIQWKFPIPTDQDS